MHPTVTRVILSLVVFAALIDVFSSYAHAQEVPAIDAGTIDEPDAAPPADGVGSSPLLSVTTPATKGPMPPTDIIGQPKIVYDYTTALYERSGLWAAVMAALYALFSTLGKRSGPGSFLGAGRVAMGISAGTSVLASVIDAQINHVPGGWLAAVSTLIIAVAAVYAPHTVHKQQQAQPA